MRNRATSINAFKQRIDTKTPEGSRFNGGYLERRDQRIQRFQKRDPNRPISR